MKVTQERLPASQIGLKIEIPAEKTQTTYERVVNNLARQTTIPGFRKGKVPRKVLLKRIGEKRIKAMALEELLQSSIEEAIDQEQVKSLGNFSLDSDFDQLIETFTPNQSLEFMAKLDVEPEVEVKEYKGLKVQAEEQVYQAEKLEEYLEQVRGQKATLVPVEDRPAAIGDTVIADYKGQFPNDQGEPEGDVIPGTEAADFTVEMEVERFVPGFVEGMVGMAVAETKLVPVTFPEDYGNADLAGKDVVFTITVNEIKTKELPELDDDFAQDVSEFETLAEYKESLEKNFQDQAAETTKQNIQEAIVAAILEKNELELPAVMVEEEVNTIIQQTAYQMSQYGIDLNQIFNQDTLPGMKERSRPEAIERLSRTLFLKKIAELENIEVTEEAIAEKVASLAEDLKGKDFDQEKLKGFVSEDLLIENTLAFLQENCEVELLPEGSLSKDEGEAEEETSEA